MKKIPRITAAVLALALFLALAGCGASDGKTHLTFQIWDVAQGAGDQLGRVLDQIGGRR